MGAALGKVFDPFGQMPVNDRFWRKGDLAIFEGRFQQISDIQTHPFADASRYDNLKFCLYGDQLHNRAPFDSVTVEAANYPTDTAPGYRPRKAKLEYAMSNSFGFGRTNGALLFRKWAE